MTFSYIDVIGSIGTLLIVLTYLLLQINKIQSHSFLYSFLNLLGALLLAYSLLYNWNFASFMIEVFWIIISLIGLVKYFMRTHKAQQPSQTS